MSEINTDEIKMANNNLETYGESVFLSHLGTLLSPDITNYKTTIFIESHWRTLSQD